MSGFNFAGGVLAATLIAAGQPVQAELVVVESSLTPGQYLGSGTTGGSFEGTLGLPQNFQINSATFSLTFADDQDGFESGPRTYTGEIEGVYSHVSAYYAGGNYIDNYSRDLVATYSEDRTGEQESVALSLGSGSVSSGAGSTTSSVSTSTAPDGYVGMSSYALGYSGHTEDYRCGFFSWCTRWVPGHYDVYITYSYERVTTTTTDWTGLVTVFGSITDAGVLAELANTRTLGFSLAVTGDLLFMEGGLTLDITENSVTDPGPSSVPEPSGYALILAGLAIAGVLRRRASTPARSPF